MWSVNAAAEPGTTTPASAGSTPVASASTAVTIDGVVVASESRWSARQIVTDSVVVDGDGVEHVVTQMGGTVDGIGMIQIPAPPVLAAGDRVSLQVRLPPSVASTKSASQPASLLDVRSLERKGSLSGADDAHKSLLPGRESPGFVRSTNEYDAPLYWASGCVFITYDEAGTGHLPGDLEFEVMSSILGTWRETTQACSYLTFEVTGREPVEVGNDRKNVIKFRDRWCRPAADDEPERCYSPDAAALTTLHFVNNPENPRNGEIVDADIEFNAEYFAISHDGVSLGTAGCLADLGNTFAHEIGHLMGLEHTCRAASDPERLDHEGNPVPLCALGAALPPEIRDATMYNYQSCGETTKATPSPDDVAGVCAIYPLAEDPLECREPGTTTRRRYCSIAPAGAGSSGQLLVWLMGLAVVLLWRRRRA